MHAINEKNESEMFDESVERESKGKCVESRNTTPKKHPMLVFKAIMKQWKNTTMQLHINSYITLHFHYLIQFF